MSKKFWAEVKIWFVAMGIAVAIMAAHELTAASVDANGVSAHSHRLFAAGTWTD